MIAVDNVTRKYGALTAVDGVSFTVGRDEIVGFVGSQRGRQEHRPQDAVDLHLPDRRHHLRGRLRRRRAAPRGAPRHRLPCRRHAALPATCASTTSSASSPGARGLREGELEPHFERTVELCGIGSVLAQRISQCSTGFRQRVGLASAMIHDPPHPPARTSRPTASTRCR